VVAMTVAGTGALFLRAHYVDWQSCRFIGRLSRCSLIQWFYDSYGKAWSY